MKNGRQSLRILCALLLFVPSLAQAQISSRANRQLETLTFTAGALSVDTELPAAAALADAASATPTTPTVGAVPLLMNATTVDRQRAVVNALNSTGTGIAAAGVVGQFDDVAPTAITENQFGPIRMSTNRNLYSTLRDAAGNERGANVNASNELNTAASQTGTWTVQPGNTANTTPWLMTPYQNAANLYPNAAALADATSTPTTTRVGSNNTVYNGTNWDFLRTASLSNMPVATTLTARNSIGAVITEKGSRWYALSNPAAGSQATASIAAEASVRHVIDCVSFSAVATTAPALTAVTVNLRDGATGAGTIIWTKQLVITVGVGQEVAPFMSCGLNMPGTTNTAMTLEYSASVANVIQEVSMSGFNIN